METSLGLDNKTKQLCLHAKKRFEHSSGVSLKLKGVLNTVTAAGQLDGALFKFFRVGREAGYAADDVWRPDPRLRLGLGARASTATDDVLLSLTAKQRVAVAKSSHVVRGRHVLASYTQATLKAHYDFNPRTERWGGEAEASASHAMFRFADDQDVRVSAGARVPLTPAGPGRAAPFLEVQENCWSLTTDLRREWRVTYSL